MIRHPAAILPRVLCGLAVLVLSGRGAFAAEGNTVQELVTPVLTALKADQGELARAKAREASREAGEPLPRALVLTQVGMAFVDAAYYQDAEPYLTEALRVCDRLDPLSAVQARMNLGYLFLQKEDYARAGREYQRCEQALDAGGIDPSNPVALKLRELLPNNWGKLHERAGQYQQALDDYNLAIQRIRARLDAAKPGLREVLLLRQALVLNNRGWLLVSWGNRLRARGQLEDARATYARARTDVEKAKEIRETNLELAKVVWPKLREGPAPEAAVAESQGNLALILYFLGEYDEARQLLEASIRAKERFYGRAHPQVAAAKHNLAALYRTRKQYAEARQLHEESIALLERALGEKHPDVAVARGFLAWLDAAEGEWPGAAIEMDRTRRIFREHIHHVLSAESEAEQLAFLDTKDRNLYNAGLTLALRAGGDSRVAGASAGWVLNGKGITAEVMAMRPVLARQSGATSEAGRLYEQLLAVRDELAARALRASAGGQGQAGDQEKDLREETRLSQQLARALKTPEPHWVEVPEVQHVLATDKVLKGEAVLIEIARFDEVDFQTEGTELVGRGEHYGAWVIPPEGPVKFVDLGRADDIDRRVNALRREIERAPTKDGKDGSIDALGEGASERLFRQASQALSDKLLGPLNRYIDSKERWVISPDGQLWLVPWAALILPAGGQAGQYVVQKHTVSYVSSGRDLLLANQPPAASRDRPLLVADPDYGEDSGGEGALVFPRLRFTRLEAEAVLPSLRQYAGSEPNYKKRGEAQESVFRDLHGPKAVVLATHGFFLKDRSPNPFLSCGLAFAGANRRDPAKAAGTLAKNDGILFGLEILSTDLVGTDLVVLSACETAVGKVEDGEGVRSLQYAFQLAGSRSVVATLWEVPEGETALLMSEFFKNLGVEGMDKARALREAQRARLKARLTSSKRAAHPFYWAAPRLTGQWQGN